MRRNPYEILADLSIFTLKSNDITDGEKLGSHQISRSLGGKDRSPHLSWKNHPKQTKSFALTVYDPDAPTPSGFWHWAVFNIPRDIDELQSCAGDDVGCLPAGSRVLENDRGLTSFVGAAPPPETGRHRYFFVLYALDTENLVIDRSSTPAFMTLSALPHTLAWASLVPWYEQV